MRDDRDGYGDGEARAVAELVPATAVDVVPGLRVHRALPRRALRRIGPVALCDHFGPTTPQAPGADVPPHAHVGLQAVTYLFSGAIEHRDSLGSLKVVRPGDVNWMTAGRGVTHAEHVLPGEGPLHGVQVWVALPRAHRKTEPAFSHHSEIELPQLCFAGARARILAGRIGDTASPIALFHPITLVDVEIDANMSVSIEVDATHALGLYVVMGDVLVGPRSTAVEAHTLARLSDGEPVVWLRSASEKPARALLLGGAPIEEPTVIWRNFIVDTLDEGRAKQADWDAGRFPKIPAR